jgi:4-hydroxybenzoate polyprenyltransferase
MNVHKLCGVFASSRPLQASFSVVQPIIVALIALSGFPELQLLILLVVGCVTGFFAVFALNDLLDFKIDKKSLKSERIAKSWDVDSLLVRHPLAQGVITRAEQIAWIAINGVVAGVIIYYLNFMALFLFLVAITLETIYCKMATVSEMKFLISGIMVGIGALIGWYAVGANTNIAVILFVILTLAANTALGVFASMGLVYIIMSSLVGIYLLLLPGLSLIKNPTSNEALRYFNKGSLYPIFIFAIIVIDYGLGLI